MSSINKSDFYAFFKNDELCDFLQSKYICPTQLRDMLEKIILEVLCERVSKTDLIREGMEKSIKNYSTMKKPDYKQLWNAVKPIDISNAKRIKTCNKRNTKK